MAISKDDQRFLASMLFTFFVGISGFYAGHLSGYKQGWSDMQHHSECTLIRATIDEMNVDVNQGDKVEAIGTVKKFCEDDWNHYPVVNPKK